LGVFRRFFEEIVEQCRAAGLVWGKELYFDATQVDANASVDSIAPRFAVEAHLSDLFDSPEVLSDAVDPTDVPRQLPTAAAEPTRAELAEMNAVRHDWLARDGRPDRTVRHGSYRRRTDFEASTTDPTRR
jgi:hypothetical protein